ncbi:MAG: diguanylate cyclase [Anaerolineaceae bacterium]|nr:diguanylate cyclase [Anaerolineaceae bacterium]
MTQFLSFLYLIISLITITFLISFAVYAIRNRVSVGAVPFAIWLGFTSGWLFVQNLIAYLPQDLVSIGLRIELFLLSFIPATFLLFILQFTAHKRWNNSWRQSMIFIFPLVTIVFGLNTKFDEMIWKNVELFSFNNLNIVDFNFGNWFFVFWIYSVMLYGFIFYEINNHSKLSINIEKSQAIMFKLSAGISFTLSILCLVPLFQPEILKITAIGLGISGILIGFSIYHYQLFDLSPLIYHSLLENIQDGILVVNKSYRLLQINRKAKTVLNLNGDTVVGEVLHSLLPVSSPWLDAILFKQNDLVIRSEDEQETYYEIIFSPLSTRNQNPNELILIRDVTEYKTSKMAEQSVREMAEIRAMELDVLRKVAEQLNQSVELKDVMSMGLEAIVSLIGARFGYVILADEFGRPGLAGSYKLPEPVKEAFDAYPICPVCKSFERLLNGEYQEPVTFMPCRVLFDVSISYPGLISIPLKLGERRIGFLHLVMAPEVVFSGDEISLLQTLGDQFSAAVERARMYENFEKMAMIDSLTGLYNRRQLFNLGQIEFSRACRYNHSISVIMLDIDLFKKVNDVYGHIIGDQVLQQIANRCRSVLRTSDIIGRYGGEEFVILLPETSIHHAQNIANRMRLLVLDRPIMTDRGDVSISVSLGISSMEGDCDSRLEWVIDQADQALLKAKDLGRNRVVIWKENQLPLYQKIDKPK